MSDGKAPIWPRRQRRCRWGDVRFHAAAKNSRHVTAGTEIDSGLASARRWFGEGATWHRGCLKRRHDIYTCRPQNPAIRLRPALDLPARCQRDHLRAGRTGPSLLRRLRRAALGRVVVGGRALRGSVRRAPAARGDRATSARGRLGADGSGTDRSPCGLTARLRGREQAPHRSPAGAAGILRIRSRIVPTIEAPAHCNARKALRHQGYDDCLSFAVSVPGRRGRNSGGAS